MVSSIRSGERQVNVAARHSAHNANKMDSHCHNNIIVTICQLIPSEDNDSALRSDWGRIESERVGFVDVEQIRGLI